jgi:hypothetical protein
MGEEYRLMVFENRVHGHVACSVKVRNAYKILVRKSDRKRLL